MSRSNDMTAADHALFDRAPKWVLYAIVKHLAAAACAEGYDDALASGSYLERVRAEWAALHAAGVISQKPPASIS